MTKEYVQMVGRMDYFWGWPLMSSYNRSVAFAKAPEPGLMGAGVSSSRCGRVGEGIG